MNYKNIDNHRTITVHHSIDAERLKQLASQDHFPSLTIYTNTFKKGTEAKQNNVQIENCIKEASVKLLELGMEQSLVTQFLNPILEIANDYELMQHLDEGIAMFISLSEVTLYTLPCAFIQEVTVDNIFDLRQIMICENNNPQFYLLHITENSVSLFEGDNTTMIPVGLPKSIPESMDERWDLEERGMQTQSHPVASDGGGMFRGNVPLKDVEDKFIKKYLQDIENGLMEKIFPANPTKPLIFAGDPSIIAMYKEVNKYGLLLDDTIIGNYESNHQELHIKANAVMEKWIAAKTQTVIDRYEELKGRDVTTNNIPSILPAAYTGAMDTLLIADNAELKGSYELHTNKLDLESDTDHDLINELIVQTILQNGRIIVVRREKMPDQEDVAAILRFAVSMTAT